MGEFALGQLAGAATPHRARRGRGAPRRGGTARANRGEELGPKTVGLLGYGNTARALARRLSGFGCAVLAYDNDPTVFSDGQARLVPLAELQARAEVLSIHIPYSMANHQFVNEAFMAAFAHRFWLVNTARGEVVDQAALRAACAAARCAARPSTCSTTKSSLPSLPLSKPRSTTCARLPAWCSRHIGGWTHQSYVRINEVLAAKISKFLVLNS
ncbi:MAG: NAD(P)-dependent oxidoreductase [Hymenobacter sp.]